MRKYVRPIVFFIVTILGITMLSFALSYLSPGDPLEIKLTEFGIAPSEEALAKAREEYGMDKPVYQQYLIWLGDFLKGDFGTSIRSNRSVSDVLLEALPNTMVLALSSMLLTIAVSVPVGILCARYKDSLFDKIVQNICYLFISFPIFFISLILMYFLALKLGLLPVVGSGSNLKTIIMPTIALSVNLTATYIKQVRTLALREMQNDYVKGLRSRGVSEKDIFWRHILKNCLTTIITLTGSSLGTLLGGTIVVENIFNWPGVGKVAIESISSRDYPVIQGYVVWMALIYFIINIVVDLVYVRLNPKLVLTDIEV